MAALFEPPAGMAPLWYAFRLMGINAGFYGKIYMPHLCTLQMTAPNVSSIMLQIFKSFTFEADNKSKQSWQSGCLGIGIS